MRYLLIYPVFLILSISNLSAQGELQFGQRLIIGNSLTYIQDRVEGVKNTYHELTWNKNISINLTKSFYLGLSHQNIFTQGSSYNLIDQKSNYNIISLFLQYDFIPKKADKIALELSWNYGDYCTCGFRDPYKEQWINYLGLGGSYEMRLNKILSAEVGFYLYNILEPIEAKYGFNQYVVGLNFDIINK